MLLLQRLWNSYCEMTDHDHHTEMQYLMAHHTWEEERTSSRVFFIDFCFPVSFIGPQGFLDFPIANLTYYLQHRQVRHFYQDVVNHYHYQDYKI